MPVIVTALFQGMRRMLVAAREIGAGERHGVEDVLAVEHRAVDLKILPLGSGEVAGLVAHRKIRRGEVVSMAILRAPWMVLAFQPVAFVDEQLKFRTMTTVVPLQSGAEGQTVLVRDPSTGEILAAPGLASFGEQSGWTGGSHLKFETAGPIVGTGSGGARQSLGS
jgi:flagella basal body P-ring formation protein FlgA